ncbi:MAG TPA: RNHCP domain-containing protein [Ktedonobacterales bacterium]|nr:RNHCP domain-containing protein [Ktedonobacterales bacterium]
MRFERQARGKREEAPRAQAGDERARRQRGDGRRARAGENEREGAQRVRGEERRAREQGRRMRLPLEEPPARAQFRGRGHTPEQSFKCGHCKRFIGPLPSGGHHRNHCPFCLYSRHVDASRSGDRASACGAVMQPIGAFQRPNGEHVIVHRCLGCGFERFNRIAADDDFELVLSLPVVPPRSARPTEMS